MHTRRNVVLVVFGMLSAIALLLCMLSFWHTKGSEPLVIKAKYSPTIDPVSDQRAASKTRPLESRRSMQSQPNSRSVTIRVQGVDGRAIPEAEVVSACSGTSSLVGHTNNDGLVTYRRPSESIEIRIIARAKGFAPNAASLMVEQYNITVTLQSEATISGAVSFPDGSYPEAGVRVVAYQSEYRPRLEQLEAAIEGFPDEHFSIGSPSSTGHFSLGGVSPGRHYTLIAGGNGHISTRPAYTLAGAENVQLFIGALYVAELEIVDASGSRPGGSALTISAGSFSTTGDINTKGVTVLSAVLAGFPRESVSVPELSGLQFLLCDDSNQARLGPFSAHAEYLGYKPAEVEFYADRWDGNLRVQLVELEPSSSDFGSIQVEFSTLMPQSAEPTCNLGVGYVSLMRKSQFANERQEYRIPISHINTQPMILDHVPCGRYGMRFIASSEMFAFPLVTEPVFELEVGSETALFEVDNSSTGAIECRLEWQDPDLPIWIKVRRQEGKRSGSVSFGRAPYVVECLPAGEYVVVVKTYAGTVTDGDTIRAEWTTLEEMSMSVEPGKIAVVTVPRP